MEQETTITAPDFNGQTQTFAIGDKVTFNPGGETRRQTTWTGEIVSFPKSETRGVLIGFSALRYGFAAFEPSKFVKA